MAHLVTVNVDARHTPVGKVIAKFNLRVDETPRVGDIIRLPPANVPPMSNPAVAASVYSPLDEAGTAWHFCLVTRVYSNYSNTAAPLIDVWAVWPINVPEQTPYSYTPGV